MVVEGKRIAMNTGLLYFRMLLLMVVSLYTSRILLSTLGEVDFGLYNVVGGVVVMLGFLQGTMSTASARFITVALGKRDINNLRKVFSNIFLVNAILALVVVFLSETIGLWFLLEKMSIPPDRLNASIWVYQFSVASVALNIVTVPFNASIIAHEKMGAFAYISLFDAIAKLIIVYLLMASPIDRLIFYASLIFLVHTIDIIIYYVYCNRRFLETKIKLEYDKSVIKNIFSFVTWSSYGSFVSVGFTQGLNILLNIFFGPTVNAARGIAVQVQNAVVSFTTNFQTAINPQLIKSVATEDVDVAKKLFVASSKISFFLLCIIGVPIFFCAEWILSIWLKEVPVHAVSFVRIMLVICIFQSIANPLRVVNQAEGDIKKFQIYECTFLLFIVPISYIALFLGAKPESVFIVQLIIEVTAQYIRTRIVLPKIKMTCTDYFFRVYSRLLIPFVISIAVVLILCNTLSMIPSHQFLGIFISEAIVLFSVLYIGLNTDERNYVFCIAKGLISRLKSVFL